MCIILLEDKKGDLVMNGIFKSMGNTFKNLSRKITSFVRNHKPLCIALIVIIIALVIASVVLSDMNKTEKGTKDGKTTAITTEGIVKDESFEGLSFKNFVLVKTGNMYTLTTDVTNTSNNEITTKQVNINIKNKDGNTIISLLGYIGEDPMAVNETRTITASTQVDLSKAYSKDITAYAE